MDISRPFTDDEAEKLPIVLVHLTRDIPWDPSRYDNTLLSDRLVHVTHIYIYLRRVETRF